MNARPDWLESLQYALDEIDIPGFILVVSPDGKLRFDMLNAAHERTTGMRSADIAGKTPHEILPPRMADTVQANYSHCLETEAPFSYEEVLSISGKEIWWQTVLSPVRFRGEIVAIAGIAIDISTRKRSEHKLQAYLREMGRLNNDLEVLSSTTAHDLRGPLRQIKLINEMLTEGFTDLGDGKLQLLQTSNELIENTLGIIDGILVNLRRGEHNRDEMSVVDFGHLISDFAALFDPFKKLEIERPDLRLLCERNILEIVLRNIFDNATRFAMTRIAFEVVATDTGFTIHVADDGPGFDPQTRPVGHAFSHKAAEADAASGFGLASAVQLVEIRGGRVWLEPARFETGATVAFSMAGEILPPKSS